MAEAKVANTDAGLVETIARRLKSSVLPGDAALPPDDLQEAAGFVLGLARIRRQGEPAIAVETSARDGRRFTRIALVNDNMPFLLDSVAAAVADYGLEIDVQFHPVVPVRRGDDGTLEAILPRSASNALRESLIYLETPRADARTRVRLRQTIEAVLTDVRAAVGDWPKLRSRMEEDADLLEETGQAEGAALLRWFNDGMLTQLGHVRRTRDGKQSGALGICKRSARAVLRKETCDLAFKWFERDSGPAPLILKANHVANVHRRVPLDLFIVPHRKGKKVEALSIHAGVWTSAAMSAPPANVPRMRAQLATAMKTLGVAPNDHDGKALVHALTTLPHDVLIGFENRELARIATRMMSLIDRPRPSLILMASPLQRHLFAFVWLPRDILSTAVRQQIQAMLEEDAQARTMDWSLEVDGRLALIRYTLDIREGGKVADEKALAAALSAMVRGWTEAVEVELAEIDEPMRAAAIAARYADAFPLAYRTASGAPEAALDIQRLRSLDDRAQDGENRRDARLHRRDNMLDSQLDLKIYQRKGALPLSDAVPMLENFGFRVLSEVPTVLNDGELGSIHDFNLQLPPSFDEADLLARADAVETAIASVLNDAAENDAFNRLIGSVGLDAREANWLRALFRYMRQAGTSFGIPTAVQALERAPKVARGLIALFTARHDPDFTGDRDEGTAKASDAIRDGLADVAAINDDRLLRQYRAVIEAIVRTNAFMPEIGPGSDTALAFKIDSSKVPGLPAPVPWREMFVYSRRVEGVHLRAGPVARGGLRWSDRRDDYRTEVLGLMKAQRVKNAVIVPTGAKGGFYPKLLPDPAQDRDAWAAEGKASYKVFIRSLLSITDNIVGDKVVHPAGLIAHDGDDPYFVVAADKGTATFSDTANALAAEKDFWLDDAFASGGSKGYDHKAMGITARGAWISVQRHFLEMGIDVQKDAVRVVGCGDMSGDVFGNGMLLSKAIRLVAAFDHRHIFIDPDPDPAKSWAERKRLFDLPRSSWDEYNRKLLSKGGGIFPRSQKSIDLSPQAREALGVDFDSADPEKIISAILKSPNDLLWFGGIGTYVKASAENNAEVGDHANGAIRVSASHLRVRVIGEGANLGVTQAGRIEFAIHGGRVNTDFIDNSAGVDCSDNEVNIKIALAAARRGGKLSESGRVALLDEMTASVSDIVLEDNRLQALSLSVAEARGAQAIPSYVRLVEVLEERGQLDRANEGIGDNEALGRRAAEGKGLTRPELAVLLSSSKIEVQEMLEASGVPDDPGLEEDLVASFPPEMRRKFRKQIEGHRLRREIIATELANRMINRIGMIHPFELVEEEGATLAQVCVAFVAAERLFGMAETWAAIETAPMAESARILLFERAAAALRPHLADLLRAGAGPSPASRLVSDLGEHVAQLQKVLSELVGDEVGRHSQALRKELAEAGAPQAEVARVGRLFDLDGAIGVARLANDTGRDALVLGRAFVDIGTPLGLDWAQSTATLMNPSDPWERLLVGGLARDFQQMRLDFLRRKLIRKTCEPAQVVANWSEAQAPAIAQFHAMVERAQSAVDVTPAMLAQLASQARSLLAR